MAMMELNALFHPSVHRQRRVLLWSLLFTSIYAFSPFHFQSSRSDGIGYSVQSRPKPTGRRSSLNGHDASADDSDDDSWLNAPDDLPPSFASRSQIPQFIDAFLEKEREARGEARPSNKYTHMIGIPMAECHQLQIELESVQRAILYHCPSLIHACIVPTMSRMPLLYVDASREPAGSVTMELYQMVQTVVRDHCYVKQPQQQQQDHDDDNDNNGQAESYDDGSFSGLNAQGYKPLTMSFHKLQIDGQDNEALFTVADRDSGGGLARLEAMVTDLKLAVEARGWKCQWPPSDVQGMQEEEERKQAGDAFIPRIALLRLPPNFESYLRPLENDDDRRTSQDGGNGISPVFWIKWEKDVMGTHVRLREVGIYPRQPGYSGLDEQTFYLPHETVKLPDANEALSQQEKIHRDYNEQRMKESERSLEELEAGEVSPDGDFADPSLASNRQMLEAIFGMDSEAYNEAPSGDDNDDEDDDDMTVDYNNGIQDNAGVDAKLGEGETLASSTTNSASPENAMQDRIRNIVESRPSQQSKMPKVSATLPPLDQNPVFQAYRDGTLLKGSADKSSEESSLDIPDVLSEEVLRGFWKVVRSPLPSLDVISDESRSDNFVLRVDGTVSGGPVLDQETFNKASGGTWRMLESVDETLLRIRLVIPPKKDRIMVWEGQIFKDSESAFNSVSILDATSFGKVIDDTKKNEEVIKCSGQVSWRSNMSVYVLTHSLTLTPI